MKHACTLLFVVLALALSGCGNQIVDDGSGFLKTASGQMIAWPTDSEIRFESDVSVPTELRESIYEGQKALNAQIERAKIAIEVSKSNAPRIVNSKDDVIGDGHNAIYFLPEPWPWTGSKANSDAMTVIVNRGATIVEADIFYRASTFIEIYKEANVADSKSSDGYAVRANIFSADGAQETPLVGTDERWARVAFIHECMHALGFGHRLTETDSIMYPAISPSRYSDPFSMNDIMRLKKLY